MNEFNFLSNQDGSAGTDVSKAGSSAEEAKGKNGRCRGLSVIHDLFSYFLHSLTDENGAADESEDPADPASALDAEATAKEWGIAPEELDRLKSLYKGQSKKRRGKKARTLRQKKIVEGHVDLSLKDDGRGNPVCHVLHFSSLPSI